MRTPLFLSGDGLGPVRRMPHHQYIESLWSAGPDRGISGHPHRRPADSPMPEKVAGKGMSWTAKLGIAAVIMVAVICIIVFIVSSISHKVSYRVEQKNLEKLESLYQSGDYEGICEYLKTVEYTYQSYFDKYTEIAGMQRYLNYLNDEDDSYLQWIVENDKADALSNISYIVSILNEC